MKQTRDFLLVSSSVQAPPSEAVLRWHAYLGGGAKSWYSRRLNCSLWGPNPAEATTRYGSETASMACVVVGAPIAFGVLDPALIQACLLTAYRREGLAALRAVDGSFCGVLIDEAASAVYVFTDRFGFRKAFVASTTALTYASSRAVVLGKGLDLPLDEAGVVSTLLMGETLGQRTLFDGCSALMPATAYDVRAQTASCYWNVAEFLAERPRTRSATDELRDRFNAACATIVAAQPVAATNLTGGFDTRAVLSAALLTANPVLGVTSGRLEADAVDAIVKRTQIRHVYFDERDDSDAGATQFALLTDGEWDATRGGSLLRHWSKVAEVAPFGCLHGGIGEVWRSYHYKFLWPRLSYVKRDPVSYLAGRLTLSRSHLFGVLSRRLARSAWEIIRQELTPAWHLVSAADGICAAMDGFYLLERQRGLTRITSAADLWNPAYAPFAHSCFVETALSYLGVQNRGETLHRAIVAGNNPALAALPVSGGDSCMPLRTLTSWTLLTTRTARHLAGRLMGTSMRRRLRRSGRPRRYPHRINTTALEAGGMFDGRGLQAAAAGAEDVEGLGNLAAVAFVQQAELGSSYPPHGSVLARGLAYSDTSG